jgi:hypothetical protein
MMGPTHRLAGALAGATYGHLMGQPWQVVAAGALVATSTSNGPASPDMDQTCPFRWLDGLPVLGVLFTHRHLTHWWGLPVAAWCWDIPALPHTPTVDIRWAATLLLIGWVSHLAGDLIFGKLPLLPWGGLRVGLGLDTGGFIETGKVRRRRFFVFGKRGEHAVIPFGPARFAIGAATVWMLAGAPVPS